MDDWRSTPEEALAEVEEDSSTSSAKGKLKIFFGYAAGVGKTYSMLKAAHAAKRKGVDVVIGYLEPHARRQTMQLARGLEALRPLAVPYRGVELREFDLDGALARKPDLVLVDELAHTNMQGCRHAKRYQDVEELLEAGIDVYTTLNVQHLEGMADAVASITGIFMQERVPDHIFDEADNIELIDIEPDNLLKRFIEGKVYGEDQTRHAMGNFFVIDNLVVLREMAMRRAADQMNERLRKTRRHGEHFSGEHVMVCVSASPLSQRPIRLASRLAMAFRADLIALVLEEAGTDDSASVQLYDNVKLAEQLGARVNTVSGDDLVEQAIEYARYSSVTKVVAGADVGSRRIPFFGLSFADRMRAVAPNLDVFIVAQKGSPVRHVEKHRIRRSISGPDIGKTLAFLILATLAGFAFQWAGLSEDTIITTYVIAVLLIAVTTDRRWYSLVSSAVSVLLYNFFFTVPYFTFYAYGSSYPVTFITMLIAALIASTLAGRLKEQKTRSVRRAYQTDVMLSTMRLLEQAGDNEVVVTGAKQIARLVERPVIAYPVKKGNIGSPRIFIPNRASQGGVLEVPVSVSSHPSAADESTLHLMASADMTGVEGLEKCLSEKERAVAQWVCKNGQHAGAGTGTLNDAQCLYLAIRGPDSTCCVLGMVMDKKYLDAEQNNLCLAILDECGLAYERSSLRRRELVAATRAKAEGLRADLLRSISHDLRTPLTAISGDADILLENSGDLSSEQCERLYLSIRDDSAWLTGLVENLLVMTRLEGKDLDGKPHIDLLPEEVADMISEALKHIDRRGGDHVIETDPMGDDLIVWADAQLIVQVIVNLVNNAVKYTQIGSHIMISAERTGEQVTVSVSDDGLGIGDEEKRDIFGLFHADSCSDGKRGMGLGLYLCKTIVEAHGGKIWVEDNVPTGSVFSFTLNRVKDDPHG